MKGHTRYGQSTIHLPRQVSCTINWTLVNWGKVGHKMPETLINTTVSTTKGSRENRDKGK